MMGVLRGSMLSLPSLLLILLFVVVSSSASSINDVPKDTNPGCGEWANAGECEKNPGYMTPNCATSCHKIAQLTAKADEELASIQSFFDLSAPDIHGTVIPFEQYRSQVTILTNVASLCGYTESHYKGLVDLWSHIKDKNINILAFPCNQFGKQEPGTADEIMEFAKSKGVKFTMMSKIDVNGPEAHIVYKYIKKVTNVSMITWNFATYFVISPDGAVSAKTGVEPMDLFEYTIGLLPNEEL